jgi:gamma-glutamylcyclotransferase (GGCT)/AIG2-like uncharacterized protein YtfP
MSGPPIHLFAYGTLMRGYALHRLLAGAATFLGEATVRGRLIDLPGYPGLVAGAGLVRGELYRLHDRELLPILDRAEGYNFERRRAGVALPDGRRSRAWVYRYRGPREHAVLIPDGNYRRAHPHPQG